MVPLPASQVTILLVEVITPEIVFLFPCVLFARIPELEFLVYSRISINSGFNELSEYLWTR